MHFHQTARHGRRTATAPSRSTCTGAANAPATTEHEGILVAGSDHQGSVVEDQRAFVARAAGGDITAAEEPARPAGELLVNFVAARAPLRE
jgi:hypothetical protein